MLSRSSTGPKTPARALLGGVGLAVLTFVFVPGCDLVEKLKKNMEKAGKVKVGDSCTVDVAACYDPEQILYCVNGKFAPFPCKGKKGCWERTNSGKEEVFCDMSGNEEGDACWTSQVVSESKKEIKRAGGQEGKGACSSDGKAMILCNDGKITHTQCRGPKGCERDGTDLFCDLSVAKEGDACEGNGAACSLDGKAMLKCVNGKSTLVSHCRGTPCRIENKQVLCDGSIAEPGDPCEEGRAACSVDKKSFLECKGGKLAETAKCKACVVDGTMVRCQ